MDTYIDIRLIDVSEGRSKGIIINERWSVGHVVFARKFESFHKGGVRKRSCSGGTSINYRLGGRRGVVVGGKWARRLGRWL